MKDLRDLQHAITEFEDGDLLAIADICDRAGGLLESVDDPDKSTLLSRIITISETLVVHGSDDSLFHELKELGRNISAGGNENTESADKPVEEEKIRALHEVRIEDLEILSSFIIEAHDHLDDIEERILDLEHNFNEHTVNDIFRSMHTIKGVSSFIGLERIKGLSHQLETVLNDLRNGDLSMEDQLIDLLLAGADTLQKMILDVEAQADAMRGREGPYVFYEGLVDTGTLEKQMKPYLEGAEEKKPSVEKDTAADTFELITPDMIQKFIEETSDLLDTSENALLQLEGDPGNRTNIEEAFRAIHTVKGNSGFFGFGILEKMCMGIEGILDTIRSHEKRPDERVISLLLRSIDGLNAALLKIQNGEIKPCEIDESDSTVLDESGADEHAGVSLLGDMLVEMEIATREAVDEALEIQNMRLGEILVKQGAVKEEEVRKALQEQGKVSASSQDQFEGYRMKRRDIRVDTERIDKLFDLMGEMITAEAMVIHNPDVRDLDLPNFDRASDYLMKISREMQEITMAIRMIPLEGLFSKMRRLVRDLSKKFDKPIDLIISGEETEMDRNVMEQISDPLLHIIRNAVDHGIESAEDRRSAGKSEKGELHLDAKYEGNEIWISVSDDGGGLNRDKIVSRSLERGLIEGDPADMKDEDVWKLIFEPGFSTAERVSEISGRGVGMDVVKRNIEKLRGKIDIQSTRGRGSTFIMKIPLTLAIIDAITFTVGNQLYSIPMTDVVKFHKAGESELTRTDADATVLNLHDELIPVIKLYDFYHISTEKQAIPEGILVIVQARDKKTAIMVDEIIGYRQIVIKNLPPQMKNIRALAGCSVMADGQVSFIIDTGALISCTLD